MTPAATPPVPEKRPVERTIHGETVVDEYAWLRDREDPAVIAHLEAENAHADAAMAHLADVREQLYTEYTTRIQQTDTSAPTPWDGWRYYQRTVEGLDYAIHCRRRGEDGDEQVLLDGNALAEGHDYMALGALSVSPDHRLLAFAVDLDGSEVFDLRIRELDTGEDVEALTGRRISYGATWTSGSDALYYVVQDEAHRPHQVWRHRLGAPVDDDVLVFEEPDARFYVGVGRTRDDAYVVISLGSAITSEAHLLDAGDLDATPRLVAAREQGVEYGVDHRHGQLLITTNADGAEDFKLVTAPADDPGRDRWTDLVPHRPGVRLLGADAFDGHVVLYERAEALTRIRLLFPETGQERVVEQPEEVYAAGPGANRHFTTSTLRYVYTSMVTPPTVIDLDVVTGERTVVKQQEVLGGFDSADYVTSRTWAEAPDGTRVPMSLVHRVGVEPDGEVPVLLYGYGSYEHSIDPTFSTLRLSLLDRGVLFAIAHVRGGGEMGRRWYEEGKYLAKPNTFSDLIACAEHLVEDGWTRPERLAIRGGSAGGLLVGAAANLRPDLFGAVVAEVPFVDVVNTMLDDTLPLTVIEYEEWGDPNDPVYYEAMRDYSPYENVWATEYPAMLVTGGLNDPRVGFWEPAKWVARLREVGTGEAPILLRTQMGAGHAGPSGRYQAWREEAEVTAFVLDRIAD